MKQARVIMSALLIAMIPCLSQAETPWPVTSANGFSCSSDAGTVTCTGSFPGHPEPELTAMGMHIAVIGAEYSDYKWMYDSVTGCLCKITSTSTGRPKSEHCISAKRREKTFTMTDNRDDGGLLWCRKEAGVP